MMLLTFPNKMDQIFNEDKTFFDISEEDPQKKNRVQHKVSTVMKDTDIELSALSNEFAR